MKEELYGKLREEIMAAVEQRFQVSDEELCGVIDSKILEYGSALTLREKLELKTGLFDSFRRLG